MGCRRRRRTDLIHMNSNSNKKQCFILYLYELFKKLSIPIKTDFIFRLQFKLTLYFNIFKYRLLITVDDFDSFSNRNSEKN